MVFTVNLKEVWNKCELTRGKILGKAMLPKTPLLIKYFYRKKVILFNCRLWNFHESRGLWDLGPLIKKET